MASYPTEECPQCEQPFTRDSLGDRSGYSILGKGDTLSLIRCHNCSIELPVPETNDISLTVASTSDEISLHLSLTDH